VAMFCQVDPDQVIAVPDVSSTYHVPMVLEKQGFTTSLEKILHLERLKIAPELILRGANTWNTWKASTSHGNYDKSVTIALVGKYTSFADSYICLSSSLSSILLWLVSGSLFLFWSMPRCYKKRARHPHQSSMTKLGRLLKQLMVFSFQLDSAIGARKV
jgi:hypothetical protein